MPFLRRNFFNVGPGSRSAQASNAFLNVASSAPEDSFISSISFLRELTYFFKSATVFLRASTSSLGVDAVFVVVFFAVAIFVSFSLDKMNNNS